MFRIGYRLPTTATAPFCPSQVRETVPIALSAPAFTRFRRYAGIGFLVAVGYMDPGNWATDIEAGSRFGYALLCVILASSLIAMLLQSLCVRLGMASGKDIAQLCREHFSPRVNLFLWALAQIAIIACDFAEVLGTALALKLLFGLPLVFGIAITALDTVIVLVMQGKGQLHVERFVAVLIAIISFSFLSEIIMSKPDWNGVAQGFIPNPAVFADPTAWLLAIGILGATVMPHNLYLHSSAVTSRKVAHTVEAKSDAIRLLTWDTILTLSCAFFVNAAILVVSASVFHYSGHNDVASIDDAHNLLAPLLGTSLAATIFAVALFASGQSSTITGTMAGQVILEGFLNLRIPCWQQRLITRLCALVPALIAISLMGDHAIGKLLVVSQVVLSMQLPFAVVPLVLFCSRRSIMGEWTIGVALRIVSWAVSIIIIAANLYLLYVLFS